MDSIRSLFQIGNGPSSSHTLGPRKAAGQYLERCPDAPAFRVTLFGSLAATGKGHLTDRVLIDAFAPRPLEILWKPEETLPFHPNALKFETVDDDGKAANPWLVYSVGGGALLVDGEKPKKCDMYRLHSLSLMMTYCQERGLSFWEYVESWEGEDIWDYLHDVWKAMQAAIDRGLQTEGVLPGGLGVPRKAAAFHTRARMSGKHFRETGLVSAYALAVAEENAAGGVVVTAPTCGSSGVLPAVLRYMKETVECSDEVIMRALATAGLIGTLVKYNASISGAAVGCQGEIGSACAMAAAAAAQIMGGTIRQIEYAAEMGLEHFLGLTCDPIGGLVQIPCIERNSFAALRGLDSAEYALFTDGSHRVSFDEVVEVMKKTGHDLPSLYRETAGGGLAGAYRDKQREQKKGL